MFVSNPLTSVSIPTSVVSIGDYAFYYNQLTSVIIPDSVTSIGDGAFRGNKLTRITMPANVILDTVHQGSFGGNVKENGNFERFYDRNGKKAGTYMYNGRSWQMEK